jgi:hypothetical protein
MTISPAYLIDENGTGIALPVQCMRPKLTIEMQQGKVIEPSLDLRFFCRRKENIRIPNLD